MPDIDFDDEPGDLQLDIMQLLTDKLSSIEIDDDDYCDLPSPCSGDIDEWIERLKRREILTCTEVRQLCDKACEILLGEPNIKPVSLPVTVCGDIHGQFNDLLELFAIAGNTPDTNFLFLGDYVDRGRYSVECASLLLCMKVRYPRRVHLIRGNHESRFLTQVYGFYDECVAKYNTALVWNYFMQTFDYLPIAANVGNEILCMHGGIDESDLTEWETLDRFNEVPHDGIIARILWSDPSDMDGIQRSPRGCGHLFGPDVTKKFLCKNALTKVVRAHQVVEDGFKLQHDDSVVTVFSAPNYCYRCGNLAAIMELGDGREPEFVQFSAAPYDGVRAPRNAPKYFT